MAIELSICFKFCRKTTYVHEYQSIPVCKNQDLHNKQREVGRSQRIQARRIRNYPPDPWPEQEKTICQATIKTVRIKIMWPTYDMWRLWQSHKQLSAYGKYHCPRDEVEATKVHINMQPAKVASDASLLPIIQNLLIPEIVLLGVALCCCLYGRTFDVPYRFFHLRYHFLRQGTENQVYNPRNWCYNVDQALIIKYTTPVPPLRKDTHPGAVRWDAKRWPTWGWSWYISAKPLKSILIHNLILG